MKFHNKAPYRDDTAGAGSYERTRTTETYDQ